MEEKKELDYFIEQINFLNLSLEKCMKKIEEEKNKIEKNWKEIEEEKNKIEENGKEIKKVKNEIEENRKEIERIKNEINGINISLTFFNRFPDFQNTENNNDKNEILNELEEVELNELFKNKEEIKCSICLENFSINDKIIYLPCIHYFHSSCIKNWIRIKNRCPICNNIIKFS